MNSYDNAEETAVDDEISRPQRVIVHTHRDLDRPMPEGQVVLHGDGVLHDITGCTYVRVTAEEWDSDYALSEHQPKDRYSQRD